MQYTVIRSNRKTISLSVNKNLSVIVRAPQKIKLSKIEQFVEKYIPWIEKQKILIKERIALQKSNFLTKKDIDQLKQKAKAFLPERVLYYSKIMKVNPTRIKITSAKTRWGSCNYQNSLCFSYRVMLLPEDLIDAIVVHELTHIKIKNHSKQFYYEVTNYMQDYQERVEELKKLAPLLPAEK